MLVNPCGEERRNQRRFALSRVGVSIAPNLDSVVDT